MHKNIAIVVSRFNEEITSKLLEGAVDRLIQKGIKQSAITVKHVPGAVEIPLIAQTLAKSEIYHAIICLGAVIRGETSHYDYVCQQVSYGCQRVMLDHDIPVIFGILTTNNVEQAEARVGGEEGHKGRDASDTALEMIAMMENLAIG
jgi:6,7-dimethyl-8-ribityllumazine synthase